MRYQLADKDSYVEGNIKHWHRTNNLYRCLMDAKRHLKAALNHVVPTDKNGRAEIKALLTLVERAQGRSASDCSRANENMRAAQGYMWEHHSAKHARDRS